MYSLLQVRKVHFDTQDHGPQTITGLEPKEVPLLHQQQGKGSMEWENSHFVSGRLLRLEWEGLWDHTSLLPLQSLDLGLLSQGATACGLGPP